MPRHVALLRGINVGGHRRVPMADLRTLAHEAGFTDVRSYVASGNLVLTAPGAPADTAATLAQALHRRFGFAVDVIARSADRWHAYLIDHPFAAEGERHPNHLMLCLGDRPATEADAIAVRARATGDEQVALSGDALWLWYADGSGRSKMTAPAGTWTTRNLNTVRALAALL